MQKAVIDVSGMRKRGAARGHPKGRQADPAAVAEVRALLGDAPRRRDLLIEFLHRIQDAFGSISAAHVVALAQELSLAMTEVYEVATFYHHFDVVKEGEAPPPAITVRVCETLSCRLAGSEALHAALAGACGPDVRVIGAPCIGRCEHAPAAVVGRNPVDQRHRRSRAGRRGAAAHRARHPEARRASRPTAGTAATACSPPACAGIRRSRTC